MNTYRAYFVLQPKGTTDKKSQDEYMSLDYGTRDKAFNSMIESLRKYTIFGLHSVVSMKIETIDNDTLLVINEEILK